LALAEVSDHLLHFHEQVLNAQLIRLFAIWLGVHKGKTVHDLVGLQANE